jgi:PhnB protein
MPVNYIPEGLHNVTPYLVVEDANRLIEFLKDAFSAQERERHLRPDGTVMHAEVKIGDSVIMLGDANEQWKPRPVSLYVYVPDTNTTYRRALEIGATSLMEPADQFYGDRNAGVTDPFGNIWWIGTHIEDVSREELERRMKQAAHKAA